MCITAKRSRPENKILHLLPESIFVFVTGRTAEFCTNIPTTLTIHLFRLRCLPCGTETFLKTDQVLISQAFTKKRMELRCSNFMEIRAQTVMKRTHETFDQKSSGATRSADAFSRKERGRPEGIALKGGF